MTNFRMGDEVCFEGMVGRLIEKRIFRTPSFLNDFVLYRVEFEDGYKEWINSKYLKKLED